MYIKKLCGLKVYLQVVSGIILFTARDIGNIVIRNLLRAYGDCCRYPVTGTQFGSNTPEFVKYDNYCLVFDVVPTN